MAHDRAVVPIRRVVCVIGLGRIGLPIALVTAEAGHTVYGVDINTHLVTELRKGQFPFSEPGLKDLYDSCRGRFRPTTKASEGTRHSSIILCCVGTRKFATDRPNLKTLWALWAQLARLSIKDKLIILKTTVPIGTTRRLATYFEELTGLKADKDFFLAFSPERVVEGRAVIELRTLPVVVGAIGERSLGRAIEFYKTMDKDVVDVVTCEAAELAKLVDNAYRITEFAFANDLSHIAERLGINAYDIIDAVNHRYPRNRIPYPTCGVGGYCLTKDPYYLEDDFAPIGKQRGFASLWMTARKSYDYRTKHVVTEVEQYIKRKGIRAREIRILVCGIAYKQDIDDVRDSHGLLIAKEFLRRGMRVSTWDPCILTKLPGIPSHKDAKTAFRGKDAAIFTVAHRQFVEIRGNVQELTALMRTPLIYDGAAVFRGLKPVNMGKFHLIGTGLPKKSD